MPQIMQGQVPADAGAPERGREPSVAAGRRAELLEIHARTAGSLEEQVVRSAPLAAVVHDPVEDGRVHDATSLVGLGVPRSDLAADGRGVDVRQSPEADTLYVRYDGEALRSHEMDVKQLAPALLSLAKAFDIMQKDVAPEARVHLNAQATREGSFTIDLLLHFVNEAEGLLTGNGVTAIVNASGLMAIYFGAVKLAKKFAAHFKPTTVEDAGKDENGLDLLDMTFPDGSRMRELKASAEALKNPELIKAIKGVIAPTLDDGVDLVQFQSGVHDETVNTEEADAISHYDPE